MLGLHGWHRHHHLLYTSGTSAPDCEGGGVAPVRQHADPKQPGRAVFEGWGASLFAVRLDLWGDRRGE